MYIFIDDELDESDWDESDPAVFVEKATSRSDQAAKIWPHDQNQAYYIGSYQSCVCGWKPVSEWDDEPDKEAKVRDRIKLVALLRTIDLSTSWLVVCWEGDQGEPMRDSETISLTDILSPVFEFEELMQYRFSVGG